MSGAETICDNSNILAQAGEDKLASIAAISGLQKRRSMVRGRGRRIGLF